MCKLKYFFLESGGQGRKNEGFSCEKCGREYKHKETLQSHLKYECGVAPQFHCPICSFSSKRRSNLNQHIKYVHNSGSNGSGVNGKKLTNFILLKVIYQISKFRDLCLTLRFF